LVDQPSILQLTYSARWDIFHRFSQGINLQDRNAGKRGLDINYINILNFLTGLKILHAELNVRGGNLRLSDAGAHLSLLQLQPLKYLSVSGVDVSFGELMMKKLTHK